jgi:hypothetical protein
MGMMRMGIGNMMKPIVIFQEISHKEDMIDMELTNF